MALRSRRLETVLNARLDDLNADDIRSLVTQEIQEEFDLDYKVAHYGGSEAEKRGLAIDVAALANTAGGIIIIGVEEDDQARAKTAPGVEITDAQITRIRQVVASQVAPIPVFDVLPVYDPHPRPLEDAQDPPVGDDQDPRVGFVVIAVARTASAPHAVLVHDGFRFPRRNGASIRYLSEPEVAAAYRDRIAGRQGQVARGSQIEDEAERHVDLAQTWLLLSLVPDLPGEMAISTDVFRAFKSEFLHRHVLVTDISVAFQRASVGSRRLIADASMNNDTNLASRAMIELHTDGSGVYGFALAGRPSPPSWQSEPPDGPDPEAEERLIDDEKLVIAVMSGLAHLADHAERRAAASGGVQLRARIFPMGYRPMEVARPPVAIIHSRGFGSEYRGKPSTEEAVAAETFASLDELAHVGAGLVAAAARLTDQIAHGFGFPEMGQLTQDGAIRLPYWGSNRAAIQEWAKEHGVEVSNEVMEA